MTSRLLFGLSIAGLFWGCILNPFDALRTALEPDPPIPWDTTFTIGSVQFPNDTVYDRSNVGAKNNARIALFLEKCKTRKSVRIGFIGGSITQGAITSSNAYRFSSLLSSFIKQAYPNLKSVEEINAGNPGTDSRFGASRAAQDMLYAKPDLVVIEFAVNDWGMQEDENRGTMEGLVRQCLLSGNDVPVMMLFTAGGNGNNTQDLHEEIGAYYGLPMISYRDAIWPLLDSGRIAWADVFRDNPHPNDDGHRLAAHLLYTYLKRAVGETGGTGSTVPAPLFTDLYQFAGIVTNTDTVVHAQKTGWNSSVRDKGRIAYQTAGDGPSTLTSTTQSKELTLGIHLHPTNSSSVHIVLEGGGLDTVLSDYRQYDQTVLFQVFVSDTAKPRTVRVEHTGTETFTLDFVLYAGRPH